MPHSRGLFSRIPLNSDDSSTSLVAHPLVGLSVNAPVGRIAMLPLPDCRCKFPRAPPVWHCRMPMSCPPLSPVTRSMRRRLTWSSRLMMPPRPAAHDFARSFRSAVARPPQHGDSAALNDAHGTREIYLESLDYRPTLPMGVTKDASIVEVAGRRLGGLQCNRRRALLPRPGQAKFAACPGGGRRMAPLPIRKWPSTFPHEFLQARMPSTKHQ